MRRPFVLRVQDDDPGRSRALARALVPHLRERGARVILDGEPLGGGTDCGVHVITAASARGRPGTSVSIGVADDDGPRWLAPIDVTEEPGLDAARVIRFLEAWGFLRSARAERTRA